MCDIVSTSAIFLALNFVCNIWGASIPLLVTLSTLFENNYIKGFVIYYYADIGQSGGLQGTLGSFDLSNFQHLTEKINLNYLFGFKASFLWT